MKHTGNAAFAAANAWGSEVSMGKRMLTIIASIVLALGMALPTTAPAWADDSAEGATPMADGWQLGDPYLDVDYEGATSEGGWMAEWIDQVTELGLMSGYRDSATQELTGEFGPQDNLTRGQAITVLYRAMTGATSDEEWGENTTPSVEEEVVTPNYYTNALNWAYENDIMTGDTDPDTEEPLNTLRPNDNITRQELALLVWRVCGEQEAEDTSNYDAAVDAGTEWEVSTSALKWTAEQDIMSGSIEEDGTYFFPGNNTRRGEAAKVFVQTYPRLPETTPDPEPDPDTEVYFTVYEQLGETSATVVKEYTRTEFEALAQAGSWSNQYTSSGSLSVGTTTYAVSIADLLEDAGVTVADDESVTVASATGTESEFAATTTWGAMSSGQFFPDAEASTYDTTNAVDVEPVLGLSYASSAVETTAAAAAAANEAAIGDETYSDGYAPRLVYGNQADDFAAGTVLAGRNFPSGADSITVTHEAYFTVFEQSGDADRVAVKAYTQEQFEELAQEGVWSATYAHNSSELTVITTTYAVSISDLLADAGIETYAEDEVTATSGTYSGSPFEYTTAWDTMTAGKFFPNAEVGSFDQTEAVDIEPVIGLNSISSSVVSTAGAAQDANIETLAAGGEAATADTPRILFGNTTEDFTTEGADSRLILGRRFVSNMDSITLVHPVYFSVYEQQAGDAESQLVKAYTRAEFEALAQAGSWSGQFTNSGGLAVGTTTNAVSLADLFEDAGVTVADDDSVTVASATGTESEFAATAMWEAMSSGQFFPAAEVGAYDTANAEDVEPVLGLNYVSSNVSTTSADAAAANEAALAGESYSDGYAPRLVYGNPADDFAAGTVLAGRNFPSGADSVTVTHAAPYFAVYEQASADADPQLVKAYTQEEFEALAQEGVWSSQYFSSGAFSVGTSTRAVAIAELLEDAGIVVADDDTLEFAADAYTSSPFTSTALWADMLAGFFYPQAGSDDYLQDNAIAVTPVLALTFASSAVDTTAAAAQAANIAAIGDATYSEGYAPRLIYGNTADSFNADGNLGGNRFPSSVQVITVVHAAE